MTKMVNVPEMKVGVVAVSRDCFLIELSQKRYREVLAECGKLGAPVVSCDTIVESGADAMKAALDILEPTLVGGKAREVVGKVVLGTVEGDLHEIGKTLVGTMLTANGFQVMDIGVDKKPEDFIAAIKEADADIVGASALLTTTMRQQKTLVDALEEAGLRNKVKVLVGGAPVTERFAKEIGADGYAEDAISAVDMAFRLMDAPA